MQNVVQNSTTDSVGNCVKHEVGHRANPAPPTSATSAKTSNSHCNSVPKSNNNTNKGNFKSNSASLSNQIHKTVTVTELTATSSASTASEHTLQQIKQTRSYPRYMPDSSDSDSDDVLSESEVGDVEDCHCPSTSTPSLDAPHFLLAAAAAAQHERHIGELQRIDPDTQARIEALLEVAGIAKLTGGDGKRLGDQEVLSRLTSSVSCALDEAAAALTRMRSETSNTIHQEERSLVEACSDGDVSAVRRLLDEGRSVHETTEEGESLLSLACSAGYYELAQVLLAMRANVEDRGVKGDCTPFDISQICN